MTGEHKNCIIAYEVERIPPHSAASDTEVIPSSCNKSGMIGKIIPIPVISRTTVKNITEIALLVFILDPLV
jgi:hypothetical protein